MFYRSRRVNAAAVAALGLAIGSAVIATSSASAAPAAIPECTSANLVAWVSPDLAQGAAGTIYNALDFTNISNHTCFLVGWPGVSAQNFTFHQLGNAAVRIDYPARRFVNVPPGGTANATLRYLGYAVDNSKACRDTDATYLNVYPPDQRAALHAYFDDPVCTVKGRTYLEIERIQPGIVRYP
jgi:Protein of unknown function (DUF4232)